MALFSAPVIAQAAKVVDLQWQSSQTYDGASFTTHTFSAVPIGTAASSRLVFVTWYAASNVDNLTMTIGGVSATKLLFSAGSTRSAALFVANVPSGTTADIVCGQPSGGTLALIGVWSAYDCSPTLYDSYTNSASGQSTTNDTLNTLDGSAIILFGGDSQSSAYTTYSFGGTGVTERFDENMGTPYTSHGGADVSGLSAGTLAVSVTFSGGTPSWTEAIFAVLQPS